MKPKGCFDNMTTMRREWWDGEHDEPVQSLHFAILYSKHKIREIRNLKPWGHYKDMLDARYHNCSASFALRHNSQG